MNLNLIFYDVPCYGSMNVSIHAYDGINSNSLGFQSVKEKKNTIFFVNNL